jgi:hypothetical protein
MMGCCYSAVLLVGLPCDEMNYDELLVETDEEGNVIEEIYSNITDLLESNGAQVFSCYYDYSGNDVGGFVIKESPDYWFSEIDLETLSDKIEKAKKDFFELTGQEGKLILTTYGR